MKKITQLALFAMTLFSSTAGAAIIEYTKVFSITDTFPSDVAGTYSFTLSGITLVELPRFNEPGTLTGVQISFTSDYSMAVVLEARDTRAEFVVGALFPYNDAGVAGTLTGTLKTELYDPSGATQTLVLPALSDSCGVNIDEAETATCFSSAPFDSSYNGSLAIGGLGLAPFIGTDGINLRLSMTGLMAGACDSDDIGDACVAGARIFWDGIFKVSYAYDTPGGGGDSSIPEPSSVLLMATGIAGMGLLRVRFIRS